MSNLNKLYIITSTAVLILFALCLYPSAATLESRWNTSHEAYSHGYYLFAAAIILTIRQWKTIKHLGITPYPLAAVPLALSCLAWLAAHIGNIQVGEQLMLPAISLSLIFLLAGHAIGKRLIFPFLLIYTVIPVWDILNPPLQYLTSSVSSNLLELIGIAVYISGNQITIPAGSFMVASGCSGLNYLLMSVFLALVYNHLYLSKFKHQLILFCAGILTGILCNWTRVTAIILIGELTQMQSSIIKDHENLGLIIFGLYILPLMLLGRHLENSSEPEATPTHAQANIKASWFIWPSLAMVFIFLTSTWHSTTPIIFDREATNKHIYQELSLLGLKPAPLTNAWRPDIHNADLALSMTSNQAINVSIYTFLSETQGKELIHDKNQIFLNQKWRNTNAYTTTTPAGIEVNIATIKSRTSSKAHQIVYWYQIGKQLTHSAQWVKPLQIQQFFLHNQQSSLIAISQACSNDCPPSPTLLLNFADRLSASYFEVMESLPLAEN